MGELQLDLIRSQLIEALPKLEQQVLVREIDILARRLAETDADVLTAILKILDQGAAVRLKLYTDFQELNRTLPRLRTREEKIKRCLEFLAGFNEPETLSEDKRAFNRWMDITAVRERARVAMHESDRLSEMVLHLLRTVLLKRYKSMEAAEITADLESLEIPRRLEVEFEDSPRWQNRVVVLKVWEGLIRSLPVRAREGVWTSDWEQRISDLMSTPEENTWVQIQAFKTMTVWNPEHCLAIIHHRFVTPDSSPDDVFLRSDLLALLDEEFTKKELTPVLREVFRKPDPSEHVRIQAGLRLASMPLDQGLSIISDLLDPDITQRDTEKVQTAAMMSLGRYLRKTDRLKQTDSTMMRLMDSVDRFMCSNSQQVQQALLESLKQLSVVHARRCPVDEIDPLDFRVLQCLDRIIGDAQYYSRVRRHAVELRESIILNRDPDARELMTMIREHREILNPGNSFDVDVDKIPGEVLLGRVLAWASADDYGYYAQPGRNSWRIFRGEQQLRRLWRIFHELTHPDPAKRQGFVHTTGRWYPGSIRAHSRYMAESTETKVPGERLFHHEEFSWRPYMPTVDDLLSVSSPQYAGKPVKIFSSEGVFTFISSSSLQDRLMVWWEITLNYKSIVRRRNVKLENLVQGHTRTYTQFIAEDLNLEVGFEPHRYLYEGKLYQVIDPDVALHLYPVVKSQLDWSPLL